MTERIDHGHLHISASGVIVIPKRTRRLIYGKSEGHCWYCGIFMESIKAMQVDHFIPHSCGGSHHLSNLVPACGYCNKAKQSRPLEQFRQILRLRNLNWSVKFTSIQIEFLEKTLGIDLGLPPLPVFYFEEKELDRSRILYFVSGGRQQ